MAKRTVKTGLGKCGCGRPAEKISSGVPECWACWNWRKLDGPAARYWAEKLESLFERGPDMYDFMNFFPAAGLEQEALATTFQTLKQLKEYSDAQIKEHRR